MEQAFYGKLNRKKRKIKKIDGDKCQRIYTVDRDNEAKNLNRSLKIRNIQGGSNMTGNDLYVNKPHCAAAVRP